MTNTITYRQMEPDEAPAVSSLILGSFDEYIGPEYSPLGIKEFHKYVQPEMISARVGRDHLVVVAHTVDGLAGMIEIRQNNHVSLLFVGKRFQRQGIARTLLHNALAEARQRTPDLERVTVNSSRYGVPAYEKLGFRQTGPERTVKGIAFIPMALQYSSGT